jgi:hypothetical protein
MSSFKPAKSFRNSDSHLQAGIQCTFNICPVLLGVENRQPHIIQNISSHQPFHQDIQHKVRCDPWSPLGLLFMLIWSKPREPQMGKKTLMYHSYSLLFIFFIV